MKQFYTGLAIAATVAGYALISTPPATKSPPQVYVLPVVEKVVAENKPPELRFSLVSRSAKYREMLVTATAYAPGDPGVDGVTYSGLPVDLGVIAVDPKVIPLGSVAHVEGYGYAVCLDVGGAINGNKIDVFFHDPDRAKQWGARKVKIRVYTETTKRQLSGNTKEGD